MLYLQHGGQRVICTVQWCHCTSCITRGIWLSCIMHAYRILSLSDVRIRRIRAIPNNNDRSADLVVIRNAPKSASQGLYGWEIGQLQPIVLHCCMLWFALGADRLASLTTAPTQPLRYRLNAIVEKINRIVRLTIETAAPIILGLLSHCYQHNTRLIHLTRRPIIRPNFSKSPRVSSTVFMSNWMRIGWKIESCIQMWYQKILAYPLDQIPGRKYESMLSSHCEHAGNS